MNISRFFSSPLSQSDWIEIDLRIEALQQSLLTSQYDVAYSSDPLFLEYYTGYNISYGAFVSSKERGLTLFLDGRYFDMIPESHLWKKKLIQGSLEESSLLELAENSHVVFQGNTLSYESAQSLMRGSLSRGVTWSSNSLFFSHLRRKKSEREQEAILKSSQLCEKGFLYLISELREGVSEEFLSQKLLSYWLDQGAKKSAFDPIIAFGKNSALPHWRSSTTCLQEGDIVLIDIGVMAYGYASDMTRTFSFGTPKVLQFDTWFHAAHRALSQAEQYADIGVYGRDLDAVARTVLKDEGFDAYFNHGLGHGVGIEVHEAPRISKLASLDEAPLLQGDVITIEPGLYFPDIGGVRLENSYIITGDGASSCMSTPFFNRYEKYFEILPEKKFL